MSPIVAHAIDSLQTKSGTTACATPATQPAVHVDQKSAFVLYIFRVPGGQDLCLSTFKPHDDVVTALDILLAAYYVRCNEQGVFQILRGGQCAASLSNNEIEVRLRIDDPADNKDETLVTRKRISNKDGNTFTTSILDVDRTAGHKKSLSSSATDNVVSTYSGLNIDQLTAAAGRSESEGLHLGSKAAQQFKEKLRTAKRSLASSEFKDQRGQRYLFYSSVTGQDLKCDQVPYANSGNDTGQPISELRFNLPTMMNKSRKKDEKMLSSNSISSSEVTTQLAYFDSRRHRSSEPLQKPSRGHSSTQSEDYPSDVPAFPADSSGVNGHRMFRPQPSLRYSFQGSDHVDANDNSWKQPPPSFVQSTDQLPTTLPPRPQRVVPPLPPRHQTCSESAIDTQDSFKIKRKAINRSENSPTTTPPPLIPPSPPKHDPTQYPFTDSAVHYLPADTDPAPPYNSSPDLSAIEQSLPPTSPQSPGRLDLSLGQEHLGGGFRGQQAKLGKLLIFGDGSKMLDLVVATNIAMFWRAWKGGNTAGRARSGSTTLG